MINKPRTFHLANLQIDPWYSRLFSKLTVSEMVMLLEWVNDHDQLGKNEFELAVNRMFLDREKPTHWLEINELAGACNILTPI